MPGKLCIAASLVIFASLPQSGSAEAEDTQAALKLIRETAADICQSVPLTQSNQTVELTGDAKAKLGGAIGKIVDLGIAGADKYNVGQSQGVLQQDLAAAIEHGNDCRLAVFNTLSGKLLPDASASRGQKTVTVERGRTAPQVSTGKIDDYLHAKGLATVGEDLTPLLNAKTIHPVFYKSSIYYGNKMGYPTIVRYDVKPNFRKSSKGR